MSGLAGLLRAGVRPGAHRWRSGLGVSQVRLAVEAAERPFRYADLAAVETMRGLHQALAATLGFPGWYGHNLDALRECLSETDPATVLLLDAWTSVGYADPRRFAGAVDLLGARLTVLLRGPGPDAVEARLPLLD